MAGTQLRYPEWRAGMKVTQARIAGMQWNTIVKQALEGVTSSTVYQDDDELIVPVEANAKYIIRFHLVANGATGGDIKCRFSVPSGTTGLRWAIGPTVGSTDRENTNMVSAVHAFTTDRPYGTVAASNQGITIVETLTVVTSSTAGNVVLQWAQNTSSATQTNIQDGSFVVWIRIG